MAAKGAVQGDEGLSGGANNRKDDFHLPIFENSPLCGTRHTLISGARFGIG
ncbi:hypothetical protein Z946_2606 [Sulfitobacter noctilucicola]|nr:hypothetical protein Z946_2606 [Sulfitobacter noctilucicola]